MSDHTESFPIQIISDLHLEIERPSPHDQPLYIYGFPVCAPNLALLGDIGWTRDERLFQWLEIQLSRFERVFMVAGNHEPYVSTLEQSTFALEEFSKRCSLSRAERTESAPPMGEFVFLNQTRYDVSPTLTILGCTLWSALNPNDLDVLSWSLTDFKRIGSFKPSSYESAHKVDLDWLTSTLEDIRSSSSARRVAIFTHHAPTVEGTGDPKYIDGPTNSAFATELTGTPCWGSPVIFWAFGHTHWNCDFEKQGVRVFSNQRGYGQTGRDFDPSKVVLL